MRIKGVSAVVEDKRSLKRCYLKFFLRLRLELSPFIFGRVALR